MIVPLILQASHSSVLPHLVVTSPDIVSALAAMPQPIQRFPCLSPHRFRYLLGSCRCNSFYNLQIDRLVEWQNGREQEKLLLV